MFLLRQGIAMYAAVCAVARARLGALCSSREESVALGLEGKVEHKCTQMWRISGAQPKQASNRAWVRRGAEEPHPAHPTFGSHPAIQMDRAGQRASNLFDFVRHISSLRPGVSECRCVFLHLCTLFLLFTLASSGMSDMPDGQTEK